MAWHRTGNQLLSEPMMESLVVHIYSTLSLNPTKNWIVFNSTQFCSLQIQYTTINMQLVQYNTYLISSMDRVRTNHSSGRPRWVKTAQGRVKLTHQSSECKFCAKKHNQPTFHETTATNLHSIRRPNSISEAAILSLLVHMLSCAW